MWLLRSQTAPERNVTKELGNDYVNAYSNVISMSTCRTRGQAKNVSCEGDFEIGGSLLPKMWWSGNIH